MTIIRICVFRNLHRELEQLIREEQRTAKARPLIIRT